MSIPRPQLGVSLKDSFDYLDSIGEYIESSVAQGSAIALTTATTANITSIVLTPGDWNVFGVVGLLPAASTSITTRSGGSSATSATLGALGSFFASPSAATVPGAVGQVHVIPTVRVQVAAGSSTTIYLVAQSTFTVSTMSAYGLISARRISAPQVIYES